MKRRKLSKEKYEMYNLRRKGTLGREMELNPLQSDNRIKESLKVTSINGVVTSWQPHPAKGPRCKKKLKNILVPGKVVHASQYSGDRGKQIPQFKAR